MLCVNYATLMQFKTLHWFYYFHSHWCKFTVSHLPITFWSRKLDTYCKTSFIVSDPLTAIPWVTSTFFSTFVYTWKVCCFIWKDNCIMFILCMEIGLCTHISCGWERLVGISFSCFNIQRMTLGQFFLVAQWHHVFAGLETTSCLCQGLEQEHCNYTKPLTTSALLVLKRKLSPFPVGLGRDRKQVEGSYIHVLLPLVDMIRQPHCCLWHAF